ncbi:site-specific DNA-methyltransferase, partial [Vibrio parahaemolyticus]|uniref:DNA methyltransferase n=1 Tax=Vibrio parahaemolyticus TaxID=670 RepID=UPI001D16C1E8
NDLSIPDILTHKRVYRGYPTEKPVSLLEVLVAQSSREGELVVDPFFGSGSTLVAAKNLNRQFKGNDISSSAHEHIRQRSDFGT